jgi:galactonate dehydratase
VHGVGFSPHNPTGPVCHAASLHVCAVAPALQRLEMQYAETPLFDDLVDHAVPKPSGGQIALPAGLGWGVRLDRKLVQALATHVA